MQKEKCIKRFIPISSVMQTKIISMDSKLCWNIFISFISQVNVLGVEVKLVFYIALSM